MRHGHTSARHSGGIESGDEIDTETKIAMLASLVDPSSFSTDQYLEALASSQGNVASAAEQLLMPRSTTVLGKRKANPTLKGWLGQPTGATVNKGKPNEAVDSTAASKPFKTQASSPKHAKSNDTSPNAFSLLKQASSSTFTSVQPRTQPQGPIFLSSQASIDARSLPLSVFAQPLPPSLASALYLLMMEESEKWDHNRFYIAGKAAKSPHTTSFYARREGGYGNGRYFYSGMEQGPAKSYFPELEEASFLVENIVNEHLQQRQRYPLEWAGRWRANVCGANRYDGAKSSVGWHADQLTYLGPYTTIASLSLGTTRSFRLRETPVSDRAFAVNDKPPRTFELTLSHNSLCLMNAGCQERFKHTVPTQKAIDLYRARFDINQNPIAEHKQAASTSRINITFRFYREAFYERIKRPKHGHVKHQEQYESQNTTSLTTI
ncbi:hypothetical protein I350_02835 [Cryptococcus amylolentus CBS 6273]|uniref:Fe2OG dioxygenase domain-containing protein n=1 Tax=Cryptococcus amylolentus CBS 6273 TaxID=1296118 RepID=A0A1E3K8B2_9TREE|nr:hypothetical protein I350_02835 [Cryptococcus amylolentus CBS 6273]